ncbi:hypothetical protein [Emcibacter sp.]|uniref:hypothetical protein n=1 Tax=Emcibacter sp. TaxID=1979954 RepID=UPI003A9293CA
MIWTEEAEERFLSVLRQTGNVSVATAAAGVPRSFIYRKRKANRRFRNLWQEAMDEALDRLEAMLWDRALGAGTKDGGRTGSSIGPDERLAIFLLKAHRPEVFSDGGQKQSPRNWTSADNARKRLLRKLAEISDRLHPGDDGENES